MSTTRCGGIIVCGGKSSRMGQSKALLPFGPEPLLVRVARCLEQVVEPVMIVAAADQVLPALPEHVEVVRDRRSDRGPLEGIAAGLSAFTGRCEAAFVTSCDAPLLKHSFARRVVELLGDHSVAVPYIGSRYHPLAAVYRVSVLSRVEQLLAHDRLRVTDLFELVDTRLISESELSAADPTFESLRNLNTPADYQAALVAAGFSRSGK